MRFNTFADLNANFKSIFMKKFLVMLAAAAVLAVASLSVSSCTKANPLVGTTWTSAPVYGTMFTITFTTEATCSVSVMAGGEYATDMGTYTWSKPTVTVMLNGMVITGTVEKKTMTAFIDGVPVVFTRS